jgi:hypothetical protein
MHLVTIAPPTCRIPPPGPACSTSFSAREPSSVAQRVVSCMHPCLTSLLAERYAPPALPRFLCHNQNPVRHPALPPASHHTAYRTDNQVTTSNDHAPVLPHAYSSAVMVAHTMQPCSILRVASSFLEYMVHVHSAVDSNSSPLNNKTAPSHKKKRAAIIKSSPQGCAVVVNSEHHKLWHCASH